jgi:hypothetical protein
VTNLIGGVERISLVGLLAIRPVDDVTGLPTDIPCEVTALRAGDGAVVAKALLHSSGLHGFLTLRPGDYVIHVEPLSLAYLPSRRTVKVPRPGGASPIVDVSLRPSPSYPPPPFGVVLRGTMRWVTAVSPAPVPVRWAAVYATLTSSSPLDVVTPAFTRTAANGDFAIFVQTAPPHDGASSPSTFTATLEIRANAPADAKAMAALAALAPADRTDLVGDGPLDAPLFDVALKNLQKLKLTLKDIDIRAGDAISLNQWSTKVPATQVVVDSTDSFDALLVT